MRQHLFKIFGSTISGKYRLGWKNFYDFWWRLQKTKVLFDNLLDIWQN